MRKTRLSFFNLAFILAVPASPFAAEAKTVRYELTVTQKEVNLSGKKTVDFALMVNGTIPSPVLEFTEGDDAEIVVRNRVPNQEVSIHWHGILLPPEEDGVAYVNTPPIHSGKDHVFRFKIRQHGTYWYHSHTGVQEQKGVYGAFIIHPRKKTIAYDRDLVAVISDWSDENADSILKNLRKDGDYYLYKKGTMRSWLGALQAGSLGNYLQNEWTRMGGMDYSDVGYDAFLINGKRDSQLMTAHPGERVRLRLINAGASSYFHVALGQAPMKVISADGVDIEPVMAKEILMGMAETYDVLFEAPEHKNYELKVTVQDGTGSASGWIGMGEKVPAPVKPFPEMYGTMEHGDHGDHGGHGNHGDHVAPQAKSASHADHPAPAAQAETQNSEHEQHGHDYDPSTDVNRHENHDGSHREPVESHDAHAGHHGDHSQHGMPSAQQGKPGGKPTPSKVLEVLTVDGLTAKEKTAFPKEKKAYDLKLVLGGDMERYVWHINGKVMSQERTIHIREGDVVRFTFENETMMHHPMHLHGHFFRVLNPSGERSPLKHTVDVPPHGRRTIEFYANEPGEWMLHCHNLYHMKTGMARVVKYMSYTPRPELARHQRHDPHLHDHWYFYGMAEAATNHAQAYLRMSQTWNQLEARVEGRNTSGRNFSFREDWELEGDLLYRRWFGQYLSGVVGGTSFEKKETAVAGVGYVLPLLIESQLLVNHQGKFRVDLEKRFQWSRTIFTDVDFTWRPDQAGALGHEAEYEISLMYSPAWSWAAGLMLTDQNIGAGIQFQF